MKPSRCKGNLDVTNDGKKLRKNDTQHFAAFNFDENFAVHCTMDKTDIELDVGYILWPSNHIPQPTILSFLFRFNSWNSSLILFLVSFFEMSAHDKKGTIFRM